MGSLEPLQEAYREVLHLGAEILKLMQSMPSDEEMEQVLRLVDQRELATQRATERFHPDLRDQVRPDLAAILQQQRAIDLQFTKLREQVQSTFQEAQQARSAMEGVKRILKTDPQARWINELL